MDISVVISCYNAEAWIVECLESACSQSFSGSYNVIIVDDGSEDGTLKKVNEISTRNSNIVLIRKSNTGLADSLNLAISQSNAKWIARLDADDLMRFDRLSLQYDYAERNDLVLLGSYFRQIDENNRYLGERRYPTKSTALVNNLLRYKMFFPHSSALYRRDKFLQCGKYNTRYKKSQDRDLWLRIAPYGQIGCFAQPLVDIRFHRGQITNQSRDGLNQSTYGFAATVCHYIRHFGGIDPSGDDELRWIEFLHWLRLKLESSGYSERRVLWNQSRQRYYESLNKGFIERLNVISGMKSKLEYLNEKLLGTTAPRILALEWIKRCAE